MNINSAPGDPLVGQSRSNFRFAFFAGLADVLIVVGLLYTFSDSVHMVVPNAEQVVMKHRDYYQLESAPEGPFRHQGLGKWLMSQPHTSDVSVKQDPWSARKVTVRYVRPMDLPPLDPPWKDLGYIGELGDNSKQEIPILSGFVPVTWLIGFAAVILFGVLRIRALRRSGELALNAGTPLSAIAWGLAGAAVAIPFASYSHQINRFLPMNPWYLDFSFDSAGPSRLVAIAVVVIIAPIAEEIVFRGLFFGRLVSAGHVWSGAIATALFFAWYHSDWHNFVPPLIIGLVAAAVYYRSRSLLAPIIVHIAANGWILWRHVL